MKLHKLAALVAILIAVPIAGVGAYLWLFARAYDYKGVFGAEASEMGDFVFYLGSPLTEIVLRFPTYAGRYLEKTDDWWALPSIVFLFVLQWVAWSQLLVFTLKLVEFLALRVPPGPSSHDDAEQIVGREAR